MPRKRTTTVERTERVTVTEEEPIPWAPGGWDITPDHAWREQRHQQVWRAANLIFAAFDDGLTQLDPETLRQSVTMLRALPGASCMEAEHGRSL